jgi:hypothetical protein
MVAILTGRKPNSAIEELTRNYLNTFVPQMTLGTGRGRVAHFADYTEGKREGLILGLVEYLLDRRMAAAEFVGGVSLLFAGDVSSALGPYVKTWPHAAGGDEKNKVLDEAVEVLLGIAVTPELIEANEEARRVEVLAGRAETLPGDEVWIRAEADKMEAEAERLRLLSS